MFAIHLSVLLKQPASHLVEDAQQPGRAGCEGRGAAPRVPDGKCAPHELVAAGGLHRVDAHVCAAQPDSSLRAAHPL